MNKFDEVISKDEQTINLGDISVIGLRDALSLFRNVDEATKDLCESEKFLVKLQANKTLFHAIDVISHVTERITNKYHDNQP
jgi:hypothetical protein